MEIIDSVIRNSPNLPAPLQQSLRAIAKNLERSKTGLNQDLRHLETAVSQWFDASMERSSGVYTRNAKGIAVVLGILIAAVTNTDTLYIATQLSKDTSLRQAITEAANNLTVNSNQSFNDLSAPNSQTQNPQPQTSQTQDFPGASSANPDAAAFPNSSEFPNPEASSGTSQVASQEAQQLEAIRTALDTTLEGIPIPIGWSSQIVEKQTQEAQAWKIPFVRRLLGWLITGIAISMGSSFWFDLLGKIIQVRNTSGLKQPSSSQSQSE